MSLTVLSLELVIDRVPRLVVEDFGCTVPIYFSLPAIFLNYIPVIVFALIVCGYSGSLSPLLSSSIGQCLILNSTLGAALFWFFRRRSQFSDVLSISHSGLSVARFLRLVCILTVFALGSLIFALIHVIEAAILTGIQPWIGWDYVHGGFDIIFTYTLSELSLNNIRELWATTLHVPIYGFLFFLFFGISGDAFDFYTTGWKRVAMALSRSKAVLPSKLPIKHMVSGMSFDERDPESFEIVGVVLFHEAMEADSKSLHHVFP